MPSAGSSPFALERLAGDVTVVSLAATTHGPDAAVLGDMLGALIAEGRSQIVVDLSGENLVNSKLLDTLVRVAAGLDPREGEAIVVVAGASYMRHMLEISAPGGLLLLAESRDEALSAFAV